MSCRGIKTFINKRNVVIAFILTALVSWGCFAKISWEYYKIAAGTSNLDCYMPQLANELGAYRDKTGKSPSDFHDIEALCKTNLKTGEKELRPCYRFTGDRYVYCVHDKVIYRLYVERREHFKVCDDSSSLDWRSLLCGKEFRYSIVGVQSDRNGERREYYKALRLLDSAPIFELEQPLWEDPANSLSTDE